MSASDVLVRLAQVEREYRAALREAQALGGGYLREWRTEQGYSQEELAGLLRVHHTYLSKIETGKTRPSIPVLSRLARIVAGAEDRPGPVVASS